MNYRIEEDSLGKIRVPAKVYYGAHTQRAVENFKIPVRFQPHFIKSYAMVKMACIKANIITGKLDKELGSVILRVSSHVASGKFSDQFPVSVYQQGAGTATNMNLNEVIANRAIELLGGKKGDYKIVHPNDHVNMSQSTNDTFHTATHVAAATLIEKELSPALYHLEKTLEKKSRQFAHIVKAGRTHMQDAVPITLGQEFSGYQASVRENSARIHHAMDGLLDVNLGGTAVGTGINTTLKYQKKVITELNEITKLKFRHPRNMFEATANLNAVLETSSALKTLSVSLLKMCNDFRLMSGMGEITLPAVAAGSSIMPGKVNPSIPEMAEMVCLQVIGNDATITAAAETGEFELNVFMPLVAYNLLNSIDMLSKACRALDQRCVWGIRANEKALEEHLERDPALATALAPYIGYRKAAEIAKRSYQTGRSIKEICLEMKILSKSQLNRILNAKNLTSPGK